jgi:DNA (cytosine-5)-methyltransferase 1
MAVHNAGFRPVLVNEYAKHACATLIANKAEPRGEAEFVPAKDDPWPLVPGDVQELKMIYLQGQVDVIAGGPPCQPFSLGGVAKGDEDKRNMFPQMFRAVREIQPKAVICENVRGLLRPSFRPYFDYILRELEFPFKERDGDSKWFEHDAVLKAAQDDKESVPKSERYDVRMFPVNAADFGVPQIRNRVIIVAFRADLDVDMDAFKQAVEPTHSELALLHSIQDGTYWDRHPDVPKHVRDHVNARVPENLPLPDGLQPWRTLRDAIKGTVYGEPALPQRLWDKLDRKDRFDEAKWPYPNHIGWPDARIYPGHTPNEYDRPAKTVKAGVHGVPGGESVLLTDDRENDNTAPGGKRYRHRYMTVRETARVMTFPDGWTLTGPRGEQMRQLGNAVPVLLGEVFAKAVASSLDEVESGS